MHSRNLKLRMLLFIFLFTLHYLINCDIIIKMEKHMNELKNIKIRKIKPEDAEQFVHLENFIYRNTYKDILPEEVILKKRANARTNPRVYKNAL